MINKENFIHLYNEGKNDVEIAQISNCSSETVRQWRIKNNLESKFSYRNFRKYDYAFLKKYLEENINLPDSKISELLNVPKGTVYSIRKKLDIKRNNLVHNKKINFSQLQKEVLFGCLLGDGSLRLDNNSKYPSFRCSHGSTQKPYSLYKSYLFYPHSTTFEYTRSKPDPRNGIFYEEVGFRIGANISLEEFYYSFYPNSEKVIPINLLDDYYSPLAMAIHFMDDGTSDFSYTFAMCSFTKENINSYREWLHRRYGIHTTLQKNNLVYIKARSRQRFTNLIKPYIIESMKYKLVS